LNPRLQKLASDWKTYVALLAAAGTAISTLSATVSGVGDAVKVFKGLPPEALWALAGVFLVIAIVALASALSRHSILREPQQFLLSPENPQHLAGREEEVRKLAGQCARHAMVFLTGDSGSGKSSLVRAGLVPALKDSELIPLVVDLSGVGWGRSLSLALARGLGRLPEDLWLALGGGDRPAVADLFAWMGKRPLHSPRRLLLVFDQFDDYLAAHRQQFYDGTTLRRSTEIEGRNPDWHGLADLLRSGAVSVLTVARSEASPSLPALGFVEEAGIAREHLTRLPGTLVAPLLSRLAEPLGEGRPVVEDPELGWLQLRSRLLRDLEASGEGQILPIQLSVALNSLRLLRSLTTAEYERIGGLRGLERLHVERHAKAAAEAAGVPTGAVLEALLTMATPDGSKTQPAARSDFDAILSRRGAAPDAAEKTVRQLEDDKLLRSIPGEQDEAETLLLYHDYLARGVREAYRQTNRWTELLRERAQIFQESVSWRQRWRALLSPFEQIRLLWERLRGRFSFNDRRRFFGLSAVRWLPVGLTLVALGVGGWAVDRYRKHEIAAQVMKAIGHGDRWQMTKEEAEELRRLSAAGYSAAFDALHLACQDGPTAARAWKRVEQLVAIAIGLDPKGKGSKELAEELVLPTLKNAQADPRSVGFAAVLASKLHLTPSAAKLIAGAIVSRMKTETNVLTLSNLGLALGSLGAKLERQDIVPLAGHLVASMKTEANAKSLERLSSVFGTFSAKLERQDVVPAAEILVARMKAETDPVHLASLNRALTSLSAKLGRQDVVPVAEILVARIKAETDFGVLATLSEVLASISAKLERQDVVAIVENFSTRLNAETDFDVLARLVEVLGSLSTKLERQDVVPMAENLVARMKAEADAYDLARLGEALGSLSARLERQDVVPGAEILVARLKAETDTGVLESLGNALGSLSAKLERQDAILGAESLVARMKVETNPVILINFGLALDSLCEKLERQDIVPLAESLVARIKTETDASVLASLGETLDSLCEKMERQDIVLLAESLVARIKTETDASTLASLGETLGSLSAKLERQDIVLLAESLVARMKTEPDASTLASLGEALGSLSAKLERQDVVFGAKSLVVRMKTETDTRTLMSLGEALGSLSSKLDSEDIVPAFSALAARIYLEDDPELRGDFSPLTHSGLTGITVALGPSLPSPVSLSNYSEPVRVEQVYADLLKYPILQGPARKELLEGLEKATGQSFSGDLWSFVDWATKTPEGRALGLDLDSPPPWSTEPLERASDPASAN